jgi:hypothetical protein
MLRAARVPDARAQQVAAGDVAWIAALPSALVVFATMMVLGPGVGALIEGGAPHDFWGALLETSVHPESTEHGRYLVSLSAPLLVSAIVLLALWRPVRMRPDVARVLVRCGQLSVALIALGMVVLVQHLHAKFGTPFAPRAYFSWPTTAWAAAGVAVIVAVVRSDRWRPRAVAAFRETPARRVISFVVALLALVAWLLTAINSDSSIGLAHEPFVEIQNALDASFAVLVGQGPLAKIHTLYSQLLPYLSAGAMAVFGATLTVYTVAAATMTGAAMLAMYAALRRAAQSSLGGLALFLPFLATSLFMIRGTLVDRLDPANLFSVFPERYAGPYLLAWLTARHLGGAGPRRAALLFVAGGLVLVNDVSFGAAALGASIAALLWTKERLTLRGIARLLAALALGVLVAGALVSVLTLVTAGTLPHFSWLTTYTRIFGSGGYVMWPLPVLGIHIAIYLTFAAAIVVATVRAVRSAPNVVLTGMLAWSGVFGFGALAYYVGQSYPENLLHVFSAWALAIVLLALVAVRALAAHASHRPTVPQLAVFFAFGLAACSLAQIPAPWGQLQRLGHGTPAPALTHNPLDRFIAADTSRGEAVLILTRLPFRIAYDTGVHNVAVFSAGFDVMPLVSELSESLDRLQRAHGHKVFVWEADLYQQELQLLRSRRFAITRTLNNSSVEQYEARYFELRDDRDGQAG